MYTQKSFPFHYPQEKKQCRLKKQRINLAITAANSGNKPRILTLVDKKKNRKKGGLAELNQATVEAEQLTENMVEMFEYWWPAICYMVWCQTSSQRNVTDYKFEMKQNESLLGASAPPLRAAEMK